MVVAVGLQALAWLGVGTALGYYAYTHFKKNGKVF